MYWLTGIAGVLLMVAPFIFSYANNAPALWTSLIAGVIVAIASIMEGLQKRDEEWEYWTVGAVGILAILAPFILGFETFTAMWATVIMGAIIAVLAGSKLWTGGGSVV